ncbi:Uncharacterized protein QTN25_006009 [Entamoeba marina]
MKTSAQPKCQNTSMKELKRCSKSYEAIQQSLVLALLNVNGIGFRVKRPERRSQKTLQLMLIEDLTTPQGVISFEKELDLKCAAHVQKELKESKFADLSPADIDSMSSISKVSTGASDLEKLKQIKRHRDANKAAMSFNELVKRAESYGYEFKRRSTKPAKLTLKMMKICQVSGKLNLSMNEINEIGKQVNENVFERFDKSSSAVDVPGKDEAIINIYKKVVEKVLNRTSIATDATTVVKDDKVIPEPSFDKLSTTVAEQPEIYQPEESYYTFDNTQQNQLPIYYYTPQTPYSGVFNNVNDENIQYTIANDPNIQTDQYIHYDPSLMYENSTKNEPSIPYDNSVQYFPSMDYNQTIFDQQNNEEPSFINFETTDTGFYPDSYFNDSLPQNYY